MVSRMQYQRKKILIFKIHSSKEKLSYITKQSKAKVFLTFFNVFLFQASCLLHSGHTLDFFAIYCGNIHLPYTF